MNVNSLVESPPKNAVYDIVHQQYVDVESEESKELKEHRDWIKRFYDEFSFMQFAIKDGTVNDQVLANWDQFMEYSFNEYLYKYYDKDNSLSDTYAKQRGAK
jgi:hypothetical protein